jgi:hypothetical protein
MNSDSITTKAVGGEGFIIMGSSASPRMPFWQPSGLGFPPQHLLPSSAPLAYPAVSARGALPVRPERHQPASITTMRLYQARRLVGGLPACPWCGANGHA